MFEINTVYACFKKVNIRFLFSLTAQEEVLRDSMDPVIERPTRADELTVKLFDTKALGQDR